MRLSQRRAAVATRSAVARSNVDMRCEMDVVGKSLPRSDGRAKVTGQAIYTADIEYKGLLHGAILRSPTPAGKIRKLNIEAARAMPGVRAVATALDAPKTRAGWVIQDTTLFAVDEVLHEGEPVAAVAADTLQQARAALEAIELTIDEITPVGTIHQAMAPGARALHPELKAYSTAPGLEFNRSQNFAVNRVFEDGDVDPVFASAHQVIEDVFEFGRQYHAYLEPKACIAAFRDGRYFIDTGHQYVFNIRDRVAQFLGCRISDVRVTGQTMGGGFGGKLDHGPEPYAAILSRLVGGRPVKMVFTREEDMLVGTSREDARVTIRSALSADGEIIARELLTDHNNGAYSGEMPALAGVALLKPRTIYRSGPTRSRFRLIYTNTTPTGAFRGVSGVPIVTAVERHMDHLANVTGQDRKEFRLRHLMDDGDMLPNRQPLHDVSITRKAFDAVEKIAPWKQFSSDKKPLEGVGIGCTGWLTNPMPGAATVKLNEDGTANVTSGTNDIGTGAMVQGVAQVVAEALGLALENVRINQTDTDLAAYDGGSQGSRTARVVGRAAFHAAMDVRRKVFEDAGPMLQADPSELDMKDGFIFRKAEPGNRIALAEISGMASAAGRGAIIGEGRHCEEPVQFDPTCASGLLFAALMTPTYHVHAAKVAVDPVTGNVKVLRYIVAQEVGRALNPAAVMGQIQGGVTQGIGYALYEGLRIENSRYVERSIEAYRLPLAIDIPEVEAVLLEHPDQTGPYGAKGTAEPPLVLAPSVIGNAIADAIGTHIPKIPITPEDILAVLEEKGVAA